jgi:hypothetical protein
MNYQAQLCYVSEPWAFFTTQPLTLQWGDDWNDAPYEHNAGDPYRWSERDGKPKWEIYRVAYYADLVTPKDGHHNSPFSVEKINKGAAPWLRVSEWASVPFRAIQAGTTLADFIKILDEIGGTVYLPHK